MMVIELLENMQINDDGGLKVQGLYKKYRRFRLQDISFDIPPGSIMGLLGKNGAGKTTIMKLLTGSISKNNGKIQIGSTDMEKEPIKAKSDIGFIIDEPMFFEKRTLWENGVVFGRFYQNFTEKEWKKWLDICKLQSSARLNTLSKGERVKFQFAFAIAHHPKVLLLDEPTGNMDPVFRKAFLEILQEIVEKERISVLFSTHLTSDLEKIADRITLLDQGKVLYTDSMERMLTRYVIVKGSPEDGKKIKKGNYPEVVGIKISRIGFEAMLDLEKVEENTSFFEMGIRDKKEFNKNMDNFGASAVRGNFPDLLWEEVDLSRWMYYKTQFGGQR